MLHGGSYDVIHFTRLRALVKCAFSSRLKARLILAIIARNMCIKSYVIGFINAFLAGSRFLEIIIHPWKSSIVLLWR